MARLVLLLAISIGLTRLAVAGACKEVGRFVSIEGDVEVRRDGALTWEPASLDRRLCEGALIRVHGNSRAALQLDGKAVLRLGQNSLLRLVDIADDPEERSWLDLDRGAVQSFSRYPQRLRIDTKHLKALIDGTEFLAEAEDDTSRLLVLEGQVRVRNAFGAVLVPPGSAAVAAIGRAPAVATVVSPRDAVQWAVYYPPLLALLDGNASAGLSPPRVRPSLQGVLELVRRGQWVRALQALDQVPATERDSADLLYRSALLLSVGRVAEAEAQIQGAIARRPRDGQAYALRAVIEVVQNQPAAALQDAERSVALARSAPALIALSYAQQANFLLPEARDTLLAAVAEHPDDALAWARLGEIWLMLGERSQAIEAAQRARSLAPDSARAQLVLGFCALAEFRNDAARTAFEQAIERSSADPLAHLGLGLVRISAGALAEGRKEIEVAVALDSNDALLRSYLGKAYFEEKRFPLDAAQYRIAKSLAPSDPTAYLYEGILQQSINRPIAALKNLQAALDRNRQRAVYRSKLLLDKDRAARGASWGRALNNLGFFELGIVESGFSLSVDPANPAAHRFLSDVYRDVGRVEVSRVSELLQAQLMQDINVNPIQPEIAETNLNIITMGGPTTPGFNEFTPLFERNRIQINGTGFGGTQNTYGGNGIVTALYDRFSLSASGFHYNSDGWRPNNQNKQAIYDIFAQAALTADFNVQAEFRRRSSNEGDLAFDFDPKDFQRDKTIERARDTARFGLRYQTALNSSLLFSYIHSSRRERLSESLAFDPLTNISLHQQDNLDSDQFEGEHIYQGDWFNLISGMAYNRTNTRTPIRISFLDSGNRVVDTIDDYEIGAVDHPHGYLYANVNLPTPVLWTLGFSYDDYVEPNFERSSFNPKFGLQWDVSPDLRLRAAAFRVLKPALANNQTIEPTQVAGFNQFFDDLNATESTRYGAGLNWRWSPEIYLGSEMTWRSLAEPVFIVGSDGSQSATMEGRNEALHNVYLYWTLNDDWALKAEFTYDYYRSQAGVSTEFYNLPEAVETFSIPLGVTYFSESGIFSGFSGTFVEQIVRRAIGANGSSGSDSFFLVDATVGYRFPKRLGILNLTIRNLFNSTFRYQDNSYREFRDGASIGPYFPERIFLGQFTLSF